VYERDIEHFFATFKMKWERFHGHVGFLERAIALIDAVACQNVTRDLDSLAGRLSIRQAFTSDYCHCPYWSTRRGRTWQKLRARKNQAAELFCEF